MNEKLFEMLDDRLNRMDEKLDRIINQHGDHKERLVKLESQAGFVKWLAGAFLAFAVATFSWFMNNNKT